MKWYDLLAALYGRNLSDSEFAVWEELLSVHKPTSEELCNAIKFASELGLRTRQWRATVPDLVDWLKQYRNHVNGNVEGAR